MNKHGKKGGINKERKEAIKGIFKLNIPMYDTFITVTDQFAEGDGVNSPARMSHLRHRTCQWSLIKLRLGGGGGEGRRIIFKNTKFPLPVCFLLVARSKMHFEVLLRLKVWNILATR